MCPGSADGSEPTSGSHMISVEPRSGAAVGGEPPPWDSTIWRTMVNETAFGSLLDDARVDALSFVRPTAQPQPSSLRPRRGRSWSRPVRPEGVVGEVVDRPPQRLGHAFHLGGDRVRHHLLLLGAPGLELCRRFRYEVSESPHPGGGGPRSRAVARRSSIIEPIRSVLRWMMAAVSASPRRWRRDRRPARHVGADDARRPQVVGRVGEEAALRRKAASRRSSI